MSSHQLLVSVPVLVFCSELPCTKHFQSIPNFIFSQIQGGKCRSIFILLHGVTLFDQHHLLKMWVFFSLCVFGFFVRIRCVNICLDFNSILLNNVSVFMLISCCLYDYSSGIQLEIWDCNISSFLLYGIQHGLQLTCIICISMMLKIVVRIAFCMVTIFTILITSIQEYGRSFHLLISSLQFLSAMS